MWTQDLEGKTQRGQATATAHGTARPGFIAGQDAPHLLHEEGLASSIFWYDQQDFSGVIRQVHEDEMTVHWPAVLLAQQADVERELLLIGWIIAQSNSVKMFGGDKQAFDFFDDQRVVLFVEAIDAPLDMHRVAINEELLADGDFGTIGWQRLLLRGLTHRVHLTPHSSATPQGWRQ